MGVALYGAFNFGQCVLQTAVARRVGIEFGHAGAQESGVGPCPEQRRAQTERCEPIAVGARFALDESVQAQSSQVVGHTAGRGGGAGEGVDTGGQLRAGEPMRLQNETHDGREQGLRVRVGVAQGTGALAVLHDRPVHLLERAFAEMTVVADALDVQQTPVGLEADPPQLRQVFQRATDVEVPGVVDRRLRPQGPAFLVVLLDAGPFVVHVQRRHHAVGDDP